MPHMKIDGQIIPGRASGAGRSHDHCRSRANKDGTTRDLPSIKRGPKRRSGHPPGDEGVPGTAPRQLGMRIRIHLSTGSDQAPPSAVLEIQTVDLRQKVQSHADTGSQTPRHAFLAEAAQYTDPFTLQSVAGHDSIKTTNALCAAPGEGCR